MAGGELFPNISGSSGRYVLQTTQPQSESAVTESERREPLSLLASVFEQTAAANGRRETQEEPSSNTLAQFLAEDDWLEQLRIWFGDRNLERLGTDARKAIVRQLQRDMAAIDVLVNKQLNTVLHHPDFQKLEASWRGLAYMVRCRERFAEAPIIVKVLNVSWTELRNDIEGAIEFDQSQFFKKVYEEGLGTPGADPFSALIVDFDIHPRPTREHPYDDIMMLRGLSGTAAAAFSPLIINASPTMFSVDDFSELRPTTDYVALHEKLDYSTWRSFRESEDSRFVSMAMPRILMRTPYNRENVEYCFGFPFEESIASADDCLWGGAAFAMGEVLMRSFAESRWFTDIRGAMRGLETGGIVIGPASDEYSTERSGSAAKPLTDIVIGDDFERSLTRLGFMPLCACKDMPLSAFYSCPSVQKFKTYDKQEASSNAKLSSMMNYMLCVSRFAHYVKVLSRDQIGTCASPEQLETMLQDWLVNYITADPDASPRIRAEKPLIEGQVKVRSIPGRAGEYRCEMHVAPHHEWDEMQATVRLDTRLIRPMDRR